MARFNAANDIDNYGGSGGSGFFSLKNHKDTAIIRFMYESVEDIEGYAVHKVKVGDKDRWVNCLREYNEPIDKCPFCSSNKYPQQVKLFLPVYDETDGKVKIWERGKKFYSTLSGIFARTKGKIVSTPFEIERNGEKGDTQTTYGIYPCERDETELKDLPELPKVLGGLVLDKSAEDMEVYLETNSFPPEDDDDGYTPVRRSAERREAEPPIRRRTPSSSRHNEDTF